MESSDRPTKMRKLSHETNRPEDILTSAPASEAETEVGTTAPNAQEDAPVNEAESATLPAHKETAPMAEHAANGEAPMSKNQLKRIRKKQEWEAKRDQRKVIRKEKLVAKRERKREDKQKLDAEGGESAEIKQAREAERRKRSLKPIQMPVTIVIDCDFDDLMHDGERTSLGAQVTRAYSDNRNSRYRSHLTVCSFGGHLKQRFDTALAVSYTHLTLPTKRIV